MKKVFGAKGQAQAKGVSLGEASQHLEAQIANIEAKVQQCDEELLKYKAQMKGKAMTQSMKTRALTVLKRKKMYEAQRDQLIGTQLSVDQQQFATVQMNTTIMTADALKTNVGLMKQQLGKIDINKLEQTTEEMQDLMFDQQEINDIMSRSYALPEGMDEYSLEAEFAELENEIAIEGFEQAMGANMPTYLPTSVPNQVSETVPDEKNGESVTV
eukprot:Platyproteum_vivax@DN5058_c0_g1_i1.p1